MFSLEAHRTVAGGGMGWDGICGFFSTGDLKDVVVEFQILRSGFHEGKFEGHVSCHWSLGTVNQQCSKINLQVEHWLIDVVDVVVTTMGWDVMDGMGWYYGQAAKLLRQRFQARKKKRNGRTGGLGTAVCFFLGVRIHYHTIQTWLEITVKLESEKPGLDMWKFISHASFQINHWGIRALCRIMGMRATFFLTIFFHATIGDALVTLV